MFQSAMLRRTMSLVIGALAASMLLTLIAFLLAGRSVTIDNEVERTIDQTFAIKRAIVDNPEIIDNESIRQILFDTSFATSGADIFLMDMDE